MNEAASAAAEDAPVFSVIVPCYNERGAIAETVAVLKQQVSEAGLPFELIVVDDGSTDGSGEILDELAATEDILRVRRHPANRGYGAALKTGIHSASGALIVITDADGTYPNERIAGMVRTTLDKDLDMLVGARTAEDAKYSWLRSIPKFFLTRYASWVAGQQIPDINSGLRVFKREVAEKFLYIMPDGFSFTTTITLAMLTNYFQVEYTPIGYAPRVGKSKIKPIRDTLNFFALIARTGMYFAPMRVIFPIGMTIFAAAMVSLGFDIVARDLTEKTLTLFLFSLNMIMFALLADMIDKRSAH